MKIFLLTMICLCGYAATHAQVAHFSFWKPYPDQKNAFEQGYKRHLQWHKNAGDTWNWYGWYIISGKRAGYFVDATFDHAWSDFDKPVNPAGDAADNDINTHPYAEFLQSFKAEYLPACSFSTDSNGLKSKLLRVVTLDVKDLREGKRLLDFAKDMLRRKGTATILAYKMTDGDYLNRLLLILGYESYADFGKSTGLEEDLALAEDRIGSKTIISISSETLVYRPDMSLFPD